MSGLSFQSLWLPHFSCLKVRHVRPVGTDQIPVYMGNQVHTLFTPEANPRYCDDIMGSERSTQRSKTKECEHVDIRAMSSICSRRGDGVSAVCLRRTRPICRAQLEAAAVQLWGQEQLPRGRLLLQQNPAEVQCFSVYNDRRQEEAN